MFKNIINSIIIAGAVVLFVYLYKKTKENKIITSRVDDTKRFIFYPSTDGKRWSFLDIPDIKLGLLDHPDIKPYYTGRIFESEINNPKYKRHRHFLDFKLPSESKLKDKDLKERFNKVSKIANVITIESASKYYQYAGDINKTFSNNT